MFLRIKWKGWRAKSSSPTENASFFKQDNEMWVCYTKRKTKHTLLSQFLLLDLWWIQHLEGVSLYSLYPKHTSSTVGQHDFPIYSILSLSVPTYFSKSVYIGYTNQSTAPLWVGNYQVNCHYKTDMSICTSGTHWTKIRLDARYCMGSEPLSQAFTAYHSRITQDHSLSNKHCKAGDSKQQYSKQIANIHWTVGLKCCYQGTRLDIHISNLSSCSRAFGWQHCWSRAICGTDSWEPDLSLLSQPQ